MSRSAFTEGSKLYREHPEWLLQQAKPARNRLLDLGNPEARNWLIEHVSALIRRDGIDVYRQDFNFTPLAYWRTHDAPDRQGISEIRHITGYLAFFDELLKRFPGLMIDTCASGGRRIDLESLRRSVPLWRSDHPYEPVSMQAQTYGLSFWVPYHGTGINSVIPYEFRSQMTPAISLGLGVETMEASSKELARLFDSWREAAKFYNGDFYPLTSWSLDNTQWMAWQFHDADAGVVPGVPPRGQSRHRRAFPTARTESGWPVHARIARWRLEAPHRQRRKTDDRGL